MSQCVGLVHSYPEDEDGRVVIRLTQDDIAGLCGATRPSVNRLLGDLADQKILEVARGRIIITDLPRLIRKAR